MLAVSVTRAFLPLLSFPSLPLFAFWQKGESVLLTGLQV